MDKQAEQHIYNSTRILLTFDGWSYKLNFGMEHHSSYIKFISIQQLVKGRYSDDGFHYLVSSCQIRTWKRNRLSSQTWSNWFFWSQKRIRAGGQKFQKMRIDDLARMCERRQRNEKSVEGLNAFDELTHCCSSLSFAAEKSKLHHSLEKLMTTEGNFAFLFWEFNITICSPLLGKENGNRIGN